MRFIHVTYRRAVSFDGSLNPRLDAPSHSFMSTAAAVVSLPEDLLSTDLDALKQALLGAADSGRPVVVEGESVNRAGTAALQLLLALARHVDEHGGKLELRAPSKVLCDAIATLGLWEHPVFGRLR